MPPVSYLLMKNSVTNEGFNGMPWQHLPLAYGAWIIAI